MVHGQRDIPVSDLDDLIARVREAGQDPHEVEELKAAQSGEQRFQAVQLAGIKKTAIVYALRYGGKALGWLLRHFSEEAAHYVITHATGLADYLEAAENWAVDKIAGFLTRLGVPAHIARGIAEIFMWLVA